MTVGPCGLGFGKRLAPGGSIRTWMDDGEIALAVRADGLRDRNKVFWAAGDWVGRKDCRSVGLEVGRRVQFGEVLLSAFCEGETD